MPPLRRPLLPSAVRRGGRALAALLVLAGALAGLSAGPARGADDPIGDVLAGEGHAEIALGRGADNHLEAAGPTVRINGHAARLIVDTGAQISVLDRRSVKRMRLRAERTGVRVFGALGGPGERLHATLAPSLQVGPFEARPFLFGVASLATLNDSRERGQAPVDGIIGADVLRTQCWVIDCAAPRMFVRLDAPQNARGSNLGAVLRRNGWAEIPLGRVSYSEFEVRAQVNDADFTLLVDTGAAVTLIDRSSAVAAGIRPEKTDILVGGAGKGRRQPLLVGTARSFRAGGFRSGEEFRVSLSDITKFARRFSKEGKPILAGYLGNDFLRARSAVIDCANLKLYLRE